MTTKTITFLQNLAKLLGEHGDVGIYVHNNKIRIESHLMTSIDATMLDETTLNEIVEFEKAKDDEILQEILGREKQTSFKLN